MHIKPGRFSFQFTKPLLFGAFILSTIASTSVHCSADDASNREAKLVDVRDGIIRTVKDVEQKVKFPESIPTTRDLVNCGFAKIMLGEDHTEAQQLILMAFDKQEMNPASPKYGELPWQISKPEIINSNALEFSCQAIGPLWIGYSSKLDKDFKDTMTPHISASIDALRKHSIPVTNTSLYLLNAVDILLVGRAIQNELAMKDGLALFDLWLDNARLIGIHEFDSPTYYGVTINCLNLGYRYAPTDDIKDKFKHALDNLWTEIAANFLPKREQLAGAHSRSYDFLRGSGNVDAYLYVEGFRREQFVERMDLEKIFLVLNGDDRGYHPSLEIRKIAIQDERIVQQKWDAEPWFDKYNYLTRGYSMGSANGSYGQQDRVFACDFASEKPLASISIVVDSTDQPYGKTRYVDKAGHSKPVHIVSNPTILQEKNFALILLDIHASKTTPSTSFMTNILLPLDAQLCSVNSEVMDAVKAVNLPLESVAIVKESDSACGVRILRMDGCGTEKPVLQAKVDPNGLKYNVGRLAAVHNKGTAVQLKDQLIKVAIIAVARDCKDEKATAQLESDIRSAVFQETVSGTNWDVTVKFGEQSYFASKDLTNRSTVSRKINDKEIQPALPLTINGKDHTPLLSGGKP